MYPESGLASVIGGVKRQVRIPRAISAFLSISARSEDMSSNPTIHQTCLTAQRCSQIVKLIRIPLTGEFADDRKEDKKRERKKKRKNYPKENRQARRIREFLERKTRESEEKEAAAKVVQVRKVGLSKHDFAP